MNILKSKKYVDKLQKPQVETKQTCKHSIRTDIYIPVAFEL